MPHQLVLPLDYGILIMAHIKKRIYLLIYPQIVLFSLKRTLLRLGDQSPWPRRRSPSQGQFYYLQ